MNNAQTVYEFEIELRWALKGSKETKTTVNRTWAYTLMQAVEQLVHIEMTKHPEYAAVTLVRLGPPLDVIAKQQAIRDGEHTLHDLVQKLMKERS